MKRGILFAALSLFPFHEAAAQPVGRFEMAYPTPSPDGFSLVFQGNFEGRSQLYLLDREGRMGRLHVSASDDTHPAWAPDGSKIAFISNGSGNDDVHVLDLATGSVRALAPHPGKDGHPKWSRDGQWIVFNRTFDPQDKEGDLDSAIMRVRSDGSGLQTISDTPRVETFASLSPDGRSVALIEWFPNAAGQTNRNGEIIVVENATGGRRNITNSDSFDGHPYWGPSGRWIYFSAVVEGPGGREFAVHRIKPNGEGLKRLTPLDGASETRGMPSADERWLYFNVTRDGQTIIVRQPLPQD